MDTNDNGQPVDGDDIQAHTSQLQAASERSASTETGRASADDDDRKLPATDVASRSSAEEMSGGYVREGLTHALTKIPTEDMPAYVKDQDAFLTFPEKVCEVVVKWCARGPLRYGATVRGLGSG